jgi:hypothetical protein
MAEETEQAPAAQEELTPEQVIEYLDKIIASLLVHAHQELRKDPERAVALINMRQQAQNLHAQVKAHHGHTTP